MRAPLQILGIPYKMTESGPRYCVLHRSDLDQWQFIAGGGEDDETPAEAAKREIWEESGVQTEEITALRSMCYVPRNIFSPRKTTHWPSDLYVVPEYAFAFRCEGDLSLSGEHTECRWLGYDEAMALLTWDSNRTALYELNCRLKDGN